MEATMTPIGAFYMEKHREMEEKYDRVVIMIEIGKFYEVYTFEVDGVEVGGAMDVSRVCNIVLTRKNKNHPVSINNPHMCGFPSHSLARYVSHLVERGMTVAVYDQAGHEDGAMTRILRGVYSPSVMVGMEEDDGLRADEDRGVMGVSVVALGDGRVAVVVVHVNTSNGAVSCLEESLGDDEVSPYLRRQHDMLRPRELLWDGGDCPWRDRHRIRWESRFREIEFQQVVLDNIYPRDRAHFSIIDDLGLARHPDVVALMVYVFVFLQEHHPLSVFRLQRPVFGCSDTRMYYSPNAMYDLNIMGGEETLMSIIDTTATPAGRRLLRRRLFEPVHDAAALEGAYAEVEALLPLVAEMDMRKNLHYDGLDAEALLRRLQVGSVSVHGVLKMIRFLGDVHGLFRFLPVGLEIQGRCAAIEEKWALMDGEVRSMWDLHFMQTWKSWDTDGVWRETPAEILVLEEEWRGDERKLHDWIRSAWGEEMIARLVFSEEEAFFQVTKKAHKDMRSQPHGTRSRVMSSGVRIQHDTLDRFFVRRRATLARLASLRKKTFQEEARAWLSCHDAVVRFVISMSARLDVILSNARCAARYRLCRPVIARGGGSKLAFAALRHLIVEVASPSSRFVANDLDLDRILLFGQNSAGKCFAKDTEMILWDGTLKKIQNIAVNDRLIGDGGGQRRVLRLTRGRGVMYDIVRTDTMETIMTVNAEHILCLCDGGRSRVLEATVRDVLASPDVYEGWMHQCTRYFYTPNNQVFYRDAYTRNEWRDLHATLLIRGYRLRYSPTEMAVDREVVPIIIDPRNGERDYYGFGLDGNQRFLMPDGTLAHNSTLMKSAGVAVVMAQAGMFVPAGRMEWTPVRSLFTKIGSRDNIWKGHSTFITEMSELKHILERSDESSLILCDELTSGTETFSATGIVASTLERLMDQKSRFIMTTHLHTLKMFSTLIEDPRLRVMHLGMEFHPEQKRLVFDRVLRAGFGRSIYGLEIAEYLGFPQDFVRKAYAYRARLDTENAAVVPAKRSRYNRKKWVDKCARCGTNRELHTHHILPQASASKDGYIGFYPKDAAHNLMTLCRACHEKEHHHDPS